jgi:L-alanine-DL-glutamate epimerase-like enolase superfamily enzyme
MIISRIIVHQPAGLLRLLTDAGLEGHCTGVAATVAETDVAAAASILIDANPVDRERLWLAFNEVDGSLSADLRACIDVALWDLAAKAAGQSVHRHVNGFRNRIPVCRWGAERESAEEIVAEAQEAQGAGFRAYKFDVFLDEESLVDLIGDVRRAVGPDFCLLLDGRTRLVIDQAIRIGRSLDAADFFCFDRPRPDSDTFGGRQLAAALDTPTSMGVSSPMEAAQVMTTQAADHVRTGVTRVGGMTDVLKAARCAEAFGAYCHLDGLGICDGFAHLHLAGAIRNTPFLEMSENEASSPFIENSLRICDGYIEIPAAPGLGMEIDMGAVNEHTEELIEI